MMSLANKIHNAVTFIPNSVEQNAYEVSTLSPSQVMGVVWRGETDENG